MMIHEDQNAWQFHNTKTDTSSYEMVEQFKYLETTLMDHNSIVKVHPCTGRMAQRGSRGIALLFHDQWH
jgi:N-dimethylarginine dimethylaminohydrolase